MSGDGRVGEQVGRYRIDSVIGQGGFASVYRAQDTVLDRPVALKMLDATALRDPTNSRRFLREGRTAANLDHPAIVPVYDAGDHDGIPWLAMRLVDGGALDEHLAAGRSFTAAETLALVRRIASALDHAHGHGLVHRDVKPSNIILEDGKPSAAWLTDFGIAVTARNMGLYTTGALGTAAYMAPEQARPNQAGPPADLYSLGCVAYELLTGRRPFPGEDYVALLMAHANDPAPPTRAAAIDKFMASALAKTVDERPQSGSALAHDLDEALKGTPANAMVALVAGASGAAASPEADVPEQMDPPGPADAPVSPPVAAAPPAPASSEAPAEVASADEALTEIDRSDRTLVNPHSVPAPSGAPSPSPQGAAPQPPPVHPAPPAPGATPVAALADGATPPQQQTPAGPGMQAVPQGWQQPAPAGSHDYPSGYPYQASHPSSPGMLPAAHQPRRRRAARVVLVTALVGIVLVALAAGVYLVTRESPEATTGITDAGKAYYEYPAGWSYNDDNGMEIRDEAGTPMIWVSHRAAGERDAVEELDADERCVGEVAPQPNLAEGSGSMARCDNPDGSMTVGAIAYDYFWVFKLDSEVGEERRDRFLDSLRFFPPDETV